MLNKLARALAFDAMSGQLMGRGQDTYFGGWRLAGSGWRCVVRNQLSAVSTDNANRQSPKANRQNSLGPHQHPFAGCVFVIDDQGGTKTLEVFRGEPQVFKIHVMTVEIDRGAAHLHAHEPEWNAQSDDSTIAGIERHDVDRLWRFRVRRRRTVRIRPKVTSVIVELDQRLLPFKFRFDLF